MAFWKVRPGIGTFISAGRSTHAGAKKALPEEDTERVVIAAKRAGLSMDELLAAIRRAWSRIVNRAVAGERL